MRTDPELIYYRSSSRVQGGSVVRTRGSRGGESGILIRESRFFFFFF